MTIRSLVRSLVLEAFETTHFLDRVKERLHDPTRISPPLDTPRVDGALDLLKRVDFPRNVSVAVNVFKSKVVYTTFTSDKMEPSRGNSLWAVVRNNDIETVFFRNGDAPPSGTEYQVSIDAVWRVVDEKGVYEITQQDLERITRKGKPADARKRGKEMDRPVVTIRGAKWYADVENERFIYGKNVNKILTFDDAFKALPEEELDAILAQLPVPVAA